MVPSTEVLVSVVAAGISLLAALRSAVSLVRQKAQMKRNYQSLLSGYATYLGNPLPTFARDSGSAQTVLGDILTQTSSWISTAVGARVNAYLLLLTSGAEYDSANGQVYAVAFASDKESRERRNLLAARYPMNQDEVARFTGPDPFIYISDVHEAGQLDLAGARDPEKKYRSVLMIPVLGPPKEERGSIVLGVLRFESAKKDAFSVDAIEYAQPIARMIGSVLSRMLAGNQSFNEELPAPTRKAVGS
ncbi:MAG: hypothetical protein JSR66_21020 [Proteobacteria bacterium]|nr:hypothetical protein [Pseudomonadota bacterium]